MGSFRFEETVQPLRDVIDFMQGWMLRMEGFMEHAEAALRELSLALPVLRPLVVPGDNFEIERGAELHGCFSPRARARSPSSASEGLDNDVLVTPVLQIMPELRELCGGPVLPFSVEHLKVDLPEISIVDLPPASSLESSKTMDADECVDFDVAISRSPKSIGWQVPAGLPLGVMEHRVLDVAALPSSATIDQVMPVSGMTIEPSVLAPTPNSNALFAKELCDWLASAEIARPGLGRSIACLLTGTPIKGKQKKVGKGKSGAIGKASLAT
ncbi:hypothetical protein VPH35_057813 [Triticum aestivum]